MASPREGAITNCLAAACPGVRLGPVAVNRPILEQTLQPPHGGLCGDNICRWLSSRRTVNVSLAFDLVITRTARRCYHLGVI